MLVNMMLNNVLIYAIGVFGVLGLVSKMVASATLNRLVKSASNMSKSNHKFMKLVKAKFEHATMANNGVDNVPIFVDKYIHEYKTLGLTLHSWRKIQQISLGIVTTSGALGSALAWYLGFGSGAVLEYATVGISATIILLAFYQIVDENHRIMGLRIYMVDYLENVLSSRYEKAKTQNGRANRIQVEENPSENMEVETQDIEARQVVKRAQTLSVDNSNEKSEPKDANVDNFDTTIIPSLKINEEIRSKNSEKSKTSQEEKIIVTNTGFGWQADEEEMQEEIQNETTLNNLGTDQISDASYTGITAREATEILESRIQTVREVKSGDDSGESERRMSIPKFHIQTLEEPSETQLTAMERMLQVEAEKRNIAKEQAGTKSTVNSAMIREILEEFMSVNPK